MADTNGAPLAGKRIVWGFGGGIAAYKAVQALRLSMQDGAEVRAAMTAAATRFVGPLTLQALTGASVFTDVLEPAPDARYGHLDLARGADLVVLAPATANLIARVRAGLADDAVTTTVLAARCPVLLAPAMNVAMWENEAVQENVAALLARGRFHVVGPAAGHLADGDVGAGRLVEPEELAAAVRRLLAPKDLAGARVLITAGPTREYLDPVRFLSNPSTGKMGYALAEAARDRGATVTLISGPTHLRAPAGVTFVPIVSADELRDAALAALPGVDAVIAAAAVADQKPERRAPQKVKKAPGPETLTLVRTPDVLATIAREVAGAARRPVLVGFAAETERLVEHARAKLHGKDLDLVVANDVTAPGAGFAVETNEVTLVARAGEPESLGRRPKSAVAGAILDRVARLLAARA
jgi:phosphopantothenoylcysteine decarboxylase/phosphopantothenate--cysteine ligase